MIALVESLDILKGVAAALSILLSVRKLYRWIRRKNSENHRIIRLEA